MTNRWLRPIALSLVLLLTPLAGAPTYGGEGAPVQSERVDRTAVVLKVRGCSGCEVIPIRAYPTNGGIDVWSGPRKSVRDGRVAFRVPRRHTRGLYFGVTPTDDRAAHLINAMPLIAWRYRGLEVGARVKPAQAASGRRATACWSGTRQRRVTFRVRVDRWWGRNRFTGERGYEVRPYLMRGGATAGTSGRTVRGTLGTQDADPCSVTR